eukprot:391451_1
MSLSENELLKLRHSNDELVKYLNNQLTEIESILNITNNDPKSSSEDESDDELLFNNYISENKIVNNSNTHISTIQSKPKHISNTSKTHVDSRTQRSVQICPTDSKTNKQSQCKKIDKTSLKKMGLSGMGHILSLGAKLSLSTETQIYAGQLFDEIVTKVPKLKIQRFTQYNTLDIVAYCLQMATKAHTNELVLTWKMLCEICNADLKKVTKFVAQMSKFRASGELKFPKVMNKNKRRNKVVTKKKKRKKRDTDRRHGK